MKFNTDDLVWANQHKAKIVFFENNQYLVHYIDGIGADWMDESCLKILIESN